MSIELCMSCGGKKVIVLEVRHPLYPKSWTRVYCGPCTTCDKTGHVELKTDFKQAAAVDPQEPTTNPNKRIKITLT